MKKNNLIFLIFFILFSCNNKDNKNAFDIVTQKKIDEYALVTLKTDITNFSQTDKKVVKLLIEASQIIDTIFLYENMGYLNIDNLDFTDELTKKLFELNFGPWNRIEGNKPFMENVAEKPLGAYFYPPDITLEEFENMQDSLKTSAYTFIRRDSLNNLITVPYNVELKVYIDKIAEKLDSAAEITENLQFQKYLRLKAEALKTDNYCPSDTVWLNMKNNPIDIVIGPIEIYEDKFYNCKAEHQAFVLIKDFEWSKKMEKYTLWLPFLQKALPVEEKYRSEEPGVNSDINVYEVIFIAGSAKSGGATISQNLPLDPETQVEKGIRNLQFKNIINAKFEAIIFPLSQIVFDEKQKKQVNSDAFFSNVLFAEMAKSLGIKNTLNNQGTVRDALKDYFTVADILKASVLTLFFAEKLNEVGEIKNDLSDNYITFVANILRVVRLGSSSGYAKANLICFNYLVEDGAIIYNKNTTISIDYEKMRTSVKELATKIIEIEGDGDYSAISDFVNNYSKISPELQIILDKINENEIPKDVYFEQGLDLLNL